MKRSDEPRKQQIENAFIARYLEKDIDGISVQKICDDISMSRTSFYHYYSDLYELLQELMDRCIKDLKALNTDFYLRDLKNIEDLKTCCDTLYYIRDHKELFQALLKHRGTNGFVYRWKKTIADDFRKKYVYHNRNNSGLYLILEMTTSAIIGLYEYWLYHLDEVSTEDILEAILFQVCHTLL